MKQTQTNQIIIPVAKMAQRKRLLQQKWSCILYQRLTVLGSCSTGYRWSICYHTY